MAESASRRTEADVWWTLEAPCGDRETETAGQEVAAREGHSSQTLNTPSPNAFQRPVHRARSSIVSI